MSGIFRHRWQTEVFNRQRPLVYTVVAAGTYDAVASITGTATVTIAGAVTYSAVASVTGTATTTIAGAVTYSLSSGTDTAYALRFYGHNSNATSKVRIELDNPSDPPIDVGAADFTYEWWMYCAYADNTTASIADARYSNIVVDRDIWGHARGWVFGVTRRTGPILAVCFACADTGGGWTTTYGTTDVGDSAWHHIAFTWRQSTSTLEAYVDGVSQGTRALSETNLSYPNGEAPGSGANNPYLVLGGEKHGVENFGDSAAFTGYIDEFRVSNTRRYTTTFTAPTNTFIVDADTVALFRFDEGSGTTAYDSGNVSGEENGALLVGGSPSSPEWVPSTLTVTNVGAITTVTTSTIVYGAAASITGTATVTIVGSLSAYEAVASITGTATVTIAGAVTYDYAASITGTATTTITTTAPSYSAVASITGTATVTIEGALGTYQAVASVTGTATVTIAGTVTYDYAASITGTATTTITTTAPAYSAVASITGTATVTIAGTVTYDYAASITGSAAVTITTSAVSYPAAASITGTAEVTIAGSNGQDLVAEITGTATVAIAGAVAYYPVASITGTGTTTIAGAATYEAAASIVGTAATTITTTAPAYAPVASVTGTATVTIVGAGVYEAIASVSGTAAVAITTSAIVYLASGAITGTATVTIAGSVAGGTDTYVGASTTDLARQLFSGVLIVEPTRLTARWSRRVEMDWTYLEAVRGDTNVFNGTVTSNGSAVDITGATFRFTAKAAPTDADGSAVLSETSGGGGIAIVSAPAGTYRITVAPADTSALADGLVLYYDVQMTTSGSAVYTVARGSISIVGDLSITQP